MEQLSRVFPRYSRSAGSDYGATPAGSKRHPDRGGGGGEDTASLRHPSATSTVLSGRNPRTIQNYLSILLRSKKTKQDTVGHLVGTKDTSKQRTLVTPKAGSPPVSRLISDSLRPAVKARREKSFSAPERSSANVRLKPKAGLTAKVALEGLVGTRRKSEARRERGRDLPAVTPTDSTHGLTTNKGEGYAVPPSNLPNNSFKRRLLESTGLLPAEHGGAKGLEQAREVAPPGEKVGLQQILENYPSEARHYVRLLLRARSKKSRATTTPTAPYSSTDLIGSYNNDTNQYPPPPPGADELHVSSNNHPGSSIGGGGGAESDRSDRRRAKDAERRPLSRKDSKRSIVPTARDSKGGLTFDSSQERLKEPPPDVGSEGGIAAVTSSSLSQKNNCFKPLSSRNSFLRNSLSSPTPKAPQNGPPPETSIKATQLAGPARLADPFPGLGRDPEDTLVAMGTNWNPTNAFQRSSNGRPGSYSNGTGGSANGSYLSHQLSISQAPTTMGPRYLGKRNTVSHLSGSRPSLRDSEPRYPDPVIGAPSTFQQRISEMSALESETVRWERSRKFQKKKPRSET